MTQKRLAGCSFPVAIGIIIFFVALFLVSIVTGPMGKNLLGLPEWLIVTKPRPELPASVVFHLFGFPITNSIIATWITMVFLVSFCFVASRKMTLVPGRQQSLLEFVVEALLNFCRSVAGEKNGRRFFPIVATIFLFVAFNAWLSLLPGYGSVGRINITPEGLNHLVENVEGMHLAHETEVTLLLPLEKAQEALAEGNSKEAVHEWEAFIETAEEEKGVGLTSEQAEDLVVEAKKMEPHLLRGANTDVNTPLAVALISFFFVEIIGFSTLGIGYGKKFLNLSGFVQSARLLSQGKVGPALSSLVFGVINAFVGIIEFVSELIRIVSLTIRLFGNMTAGEILLLVAGFLMPWLFALPFYGLELLVGFVQALIFASLTLIFLTMAVTSHEEHAEKAAH